MECPKCGSDMEAVTYAGVEVDRCLNCRGIWFDAMEKEELKQARGSETIDVGERGIGKQYNEVDRIDCPVCHTRMVRMVDVKQPHIWYESCPVCYGTYFDAGEFADYKEETLLDYFRGILASERK